MEAVLEERKRIGFDLAPTATALEHLWKDVKLPQMDFTKAPDLPWKLKAEAPPTPAPPPTPAKKGRKKTIPPSFRIEKGYFKITFP